ncbi:3-methylcrotonyl-CoA carboxylase alpha subunit [Sphingomonas guangdongensis]|uniref:3-methylcrotonyl-CoA carboxylase alpha subunit n=1 Tax=Sphingomonas guangdongensis TaxID=1141890 RepID=A0A285QJH0_9SPHN|nr:biotin carboxylase N-terminal domain-containing protein [Sphingomonas guangdongensis]SOB80222.1 3-methylcrotonyl-CoA carboxylase alpha subunit [Sphingomonas guangdongensis]
MITSLLIANRGEIACRIIRTANALGIRTVAVYSDADAGALHVRQADAAVHIGAAPARQSYLVGERIIAAARDSGAEAIHPGYGFLSENADFAESVIAAGLVWVGPKPDSIRAMGLKDAAKARMIAAGVPVTPGYQGEDQSPERLAREAEVVGYPVLIKAVAGGGGKGMRRVDDAADFADLLQSCQREAASSFGDDRVLIEKYVLNPRHIEVQVFGDTHGQVVHLFERDCSLQRRHQKVIEEAPAPGMSAETRAEVCAAAVRAAQAVDYVGAGTIEFIADASDGLRADRIWFMEMNTRLQVEHPVTEAITGVDLVEWQLRVASGEPLPKRQDELSISGWAAEGRLYAEDPAKGFLPSIGRLDHLQLARPAFTWSNAGPSMAPQGVRVETGVEEGSDVSPYYDPMIAKLICHRDTREEALAALADVCADVQVWPVRTNAAFLARVLREPAFVAGEVDTGFIGKEAERLVATAPLSAARGSYALSVLQELAGPAARVQVPAGFRLNAAPRGDAVVVIDGAPVRVPLPSERFFQSADPASFARADEGVVVFAGGSPHLVTLATRPSAAGAGGDGAILAPMPGRVTAVEILAGASVTKGQKLLTLEAMKMEHTLVAPFDGTVAELEVEAGAQVTEGRLLVRVQS